MGLLVIEFVNEGKPVKEARSGDAEDRATVRVIVRLIQRRAVARLTGDEVGAQIALP